MKLHMIPIFVGWDVKLDKPRPSMGFYSSEMLLMTSSWKKLSLNDCVNWIWIVTSCYETPDVRCWQALSATFRSAPGALVPMLALCLVPQTLRGYHFHVTSAFFFPLIGEPAYSCSIASVKDRHHFLSHISSMGNTWCFKRQTSLFESHINRNIRYFKRRTLLLSVTFQLEINDIKKKTDIAFSVTYYQWEIHDVSKDRYHCQNHTSSMRNNWFFKSLDFLTNICDRV